MVHDPLAPDIVPATEERLRREVVAVGWQSSPDTFVGGLTLDRVEAQASVSVAKIGSGSDRCVAVAGIEAEVTDRELTVLIDRKYRPGSCEYQAILDHEQEHVRINADALEDLGARLELRLRALLDRRAGRWLRGGSEK
ncbi:MAG: hypothetical protein AB7X49_06155, partial [Geminicoccaceae bacterium]